MAKTDYKSNEENYKDFRAELETTPLSEIQHYQRMGNAGIFHDWAVRAIEDELKDRKKT